MEQSITPEEQPQSGNTEAENESSKSNCNESRKEESLQTNDECLNLCVAEAKQQAESEEDVGQGAKRKQEDENDDENKRICLVESNHSENLNHQIPSVLCQETLGSDETDHHTVPDEKYPIQYAGHSLPYATATELHPIQPLLDDSKPLEQEISPLPDESEQDAAIDLPPEDSPIASTASSHASPEEKHIPLTAESNSSDITETLRIHEKLREMGEISVKPVSKLSDPNASHAKPKEGDSEVSVEIKKKAAEMDAETKRITNLRKNIREVMDENQLDATTLAAQRQESERLARVQVQQKIIRELQRQMAVERHNNRTQNRVLSLLQGQTSIMRGSSDRSGSQSGPSIPSSGTSSDMYIVKGVASEVTFKGSNFVDVDKLSSGNLTPSVSIAPVRRMKGIPDSDMSDEESESEESDKKEVVEIVDSSSDDDCIVLSDDEEEEEPEDDPDNSGLHVKDAYNIPDEKGRVLINIGHPETEEDIFLAPQIARIIKPHQIGGVRFLYDNIIESTERFNSSTGFGCILAHSMGLGKTLQVVCFCDIFLRHTDSKSILCILPINTLQNWVAEFNMWLPEDAEKTPLNVHGEVRQRHFKIFVLNDQHKTLSARSKVILEWAKVGGVLLIGYELFRLLSLKLANKKKRGKKVNLEKEKADIEAHKRTMDDIHAALVRPGPDLVICDEGHRIKNSHASISVALKQIRSKRRIVLTGYPLQNNLLEYWCMVDFVRPNYLGTKTEFANMFERPIQNGQCIDSTPQDIKLMRYRAHVLHSLLVGFVQRRSHVVLQNSLPQKEEYVILVRMTSFQRNLYNTFMNEVVRTKAVPNPLKAFAVCCKIWNHPDVLYNFLKKREADLDLELEEVEADASSAVPATNNRGRKKGSTNKATKGVNKNGKTIPAVEVQPNQSKQTTQITDPNVEESVSPKVNEPNSPSDKPQTKEIAENDIPKPEATSSPVLQAPSENNAPPASKTPPPQSQHYPNTSSSDYSPPAETNHQTPAETSHQTPANYSNESSQGYTQQQFPPQNQTYPNNYNPYNPYEYDGYYGHQYGSMYPPPPQQYSGNSYDPSFMSNPQNNYWPNHYYGYNGAGNAMNVDPYAQGDPSYAGLVPKATEMFDGSKPPSAEEKSSEIVDLDTKEIKTVEPPIIEIKIKEELDIKKEKIENDSSENIEIKSDVEVKVENDVKKEKEELSEDPVAAVLDKEKEPKATAKDDGIPYDWAVELMKGYVPDLLSNSPKMEIFFRLLEESVQMGDRILVFSQSLLTLNLIERFLQRNLVPGADHHWAKNSTYFRLDGSTSAIEREKLINEFNANPHIHLFLVSTRAGSLGINLVGANRVVVFDASWNPCHDTQAVCRVYRYGQKKPCFVYRIVMDNCLEKKIYDRQINKQGMSDRVVDECNPDAHLSMKEVTNLCYDNEEECEVKDLTEYKDKYLDIIMQKIIEMHGESLSKEPFHHESLLVDRKEKKLSQAEKRLAQRGYEMEKRATAKPAYVYHSMGTQYRIMKTPDGSIVHRPVASVRPMQADGGDKGHAPRPGGVRPTRWIPAEVWQRQGMTAQEMTLPLDVVIPTSSGDKSNIVLKAGQKVMVLKSPKGIYMQLETGKIIAIRTSFKMNQNQSKDKSEESETNTSINSEDILTKPSVKETPASPLHQVPSNSSTANVNPNLMTGKHQPFTGDSNRTGKMNDVSMPSSPFKSSNMLPNRGFPATQTTNNSKNFNVQNLIDSKISSGQQNTNAYTHTKGNDMMHPEASRSLNAPTAAMNKMNLYNTSSKSNYPRSNYSFTSALKHAQSQGSQQSFMANVKPQMHDNKMWEPDKNQVSKGAESSLPTITIDDDIDPPLREKVIYKPNLIERKTKHQQHRSSMQGPTAAIGAANYSKGPQHKNVPSSMHSLGGNYKSPEGLRQLHNVKPYNRQYPDHRNSHAGNKSAEELAQSHPMANAANNHQEGKNSGNLSKMPSIRNIPAPFPSSCTTSTSNTITSKASLHSEPIYTQSSSSDESRSHATPSYSNDENMHRVQDKVDYQQSKGRSSKPAKQGHDSSKHEASTPQSALSNEKHQTQQYPETTQSQPEQPSVTNTYTSASASSSSISHANPDTQYAGYNQQQPNVSMYNSSPSDASYNYTRSDVTPYQSPYPDLYASGPPNPYGYPPAGQHHPPPQSGYPYGSYYDHQIYGSANSQNYGSATASNLAAPPVQSSQYHYPNYQQPPPVPPQSTDPYNSYYNYPPYPPQTGQWQQ